MSQEETELHPAWVWDCDNCGAENFCRSIVGEFDDETLEELRSEHGIQPWETGDFHTAPKNVTCYCCDAVYKTNTGVDSE